MSDRYALPMLEIHRANLAASKTFEEYRDHQVAYVDCLIERAKADLAKDQATVKFIYRVDTTDKIAGDEGETHQEQTK